MRDGVRLSARLWIPEGDTRSPAVLECIPYRKRDLYRPYDDIWGATLAAAGIVFVRIDVRGSGDSEGVMTDEYSEAELEDCVEAIAWIARQAWCTGAVGMRGLSWGGINTLQVAARRPPALKAIMPMCACDRRFTDDAHYVGGTLGRTNYQWGVLFKTVMAGPPDPLIVGEAWRDMWLKRLDATPPILATWTQHQREDAYWRRGSVFFDPRDINVPTYLVSGWSDTYAAPMLRLLERLNVPRKALIGPWGHTYPHVASPQGLNWGQEEVRWWRHWLTGEATGIMDEPTLRAFMPYGTASEAAGKAVPGRWIAEHAWPARTERRRFFLNADGLGERAVAGVVLRHRDKGVIGTTKPEWLDRLPIEQSHDDALSTVFDGPVLDAPLELLGSAKVRLSIASDTPVANVVLRLCELKPNGESWLVTWAALNLTRRESMMAPQPLEPGRSYDVSLDLRAIAHRFGAGSRIRLSLSEGLWPMLWPSPVKPTLALASGVSTLDLPVRPVEATPTLLGIEETSSGPAPFEAYRPSSPGADGRIVLTGSMPPAPYTVAGANVERSSDRDDACEIRADDPLSSIWRQRARTSWRRDGWRCEVEASYEITADAGAFRIVEALRASSDGQEVFSRRSDVRVARDLM
jgi:predicted acyl esterase